MRRATKKEIKKAEQGQTLRDCAKLSGYMRSRGVKTSPNEIFELNRYFQAAAKAINACLKQSKGPASQDS